MTLYKKAKRFQIKPISLPQELFPTVFNEKLCEQLLQLLKKWLEAAIIGFKQMQQGQNKTGGQQQLKVAAAIVRLFQKIPPSHSGKGN